MLRFGIAGMGNIGKVHAQNLQKQGLIEGAALCAVSDPVSARLAHFEEKTGVKTFNDPAAMFRSGEVDIVIIAVPTFLHASVGIDALAAGLHVVMEKPLGLHRAEAERILAARKTDDQIFAVMLNQRTQPAFQRVKRWMEEGAIGRMQRMNWTITDWYRPDIYYQSSDWRATWRGEGGGVLMNQCPHNLDLLQWFCGMPERVEGFCRIGHHHDIEVEDEVTAVLHFADGATGVFSTSTGEAPGVNRLEIAGDGGLIICEGGRCVLKRNRVGAAEFSRSTSEMFSMPGSDEEEFRTGQPVNQHAEILRNVVAAVKDGVPLLSPAEEGLCSLELAGAMQYSSWTGAPVDLPLDGEAFERALCERISLSRPREKTDRAADVDMGKSY